MTESTEPEELFPGLFRKRIPLPGNPLKAVNSYVLKGKTRNLIIDTGMNRPECREAMNTCLEGLDINLAKTDFFITHFHADHLGLVSELIRPGSMVYMGAADDASFRDPEHWTGMKAVALRNGFPATEVEQAIRQHPGFNFHARHTFSTMHLREGDTVVLDHYRFVCIETPGHTRGHLCLHEPDRRLLFSGDHVLETITPNISLWAEGENPLGSYFASLDRIYGLEISYVLPGHREPFSGIRRRIDELKAHHDTRNAEILAILASGERSACGVASQMSWDIRCRTWDDFPLPQKWFASGEALAHLQFLECGNRVRRVVRNGGAVFRIA